MPEMKKTEKELLLIIEDGVPPSVHLLSHVTDFIRDSLKGIDSPNSLSIHLSEARENARKILDSQDQRSGNDSYLKYLNKLQELLFSYAKPSVPELNKLYSKTMVFLDANI